MPRGRKRKTPAEEMEAALLEPAVENPTSNIIDSNIVSTTFHVVQSVATPKMVTWCCGDSAFGSLPSPTFDQTRCTSDDVFGHVPMQLRQRIWNNQFVNLTLMLKRSLELQDYCSGGGDPSPRTKWDHRDKAKGGQIPNSKHQSMD
ncbi:hypothetical protein DPMN_086621 [Dreissena polymorpha]|uniref:Uncharacterized protein n=1 Tax=Dreissena polymorpha TaxID=45954 RepID=A0A9D4QVD1_DREPO|nr:hypothetical protein DPMN_086621 [Dreissena polymorpha]